MLFRKFCAAFLILTLFPLLLQAQELPFRHYNIADGLISNNVTSMCQDSLGFLWIATTDGISRYDSQEFSNYTIADGLSSNNISCIIADNRQPAVVWIGTDKKGVDQYSEGRFINYVVGTNEKQNSINALLEDDEGRIWCGTADGVFLIQNAQHGIHDHWLNGLTVTSIAVSKNKELFFGTNAGIYFFRDSAYIPVQFPCSAILHKNINQLFIDSDNNMWISTLNGDVVLCNNCNPKSYFVSGRKEITSQFAEDVEHRIWMSTTSGLFVTTEREFKQNIFVHYAKENGLQVEGLSSVMVDREGVVWAGSLQDGFVNLPSTDLIEFSFPKNENVQWSSTTADSFGNFWVTDGKSLMEIFRNSAGKWEHIVTPSSTTGNTKSLTKIVYDKSRNELICTYDNGTIECWEVLQRTGGASELKLSRKVNLTKFISFTSLFTLCLAQDGSLWCSLLDRGVAVISADLSRIIKLYTSKDILPDNSIRTIFQDSHGSIWIGGYDGGLVKLPQEFIQHDLNNETTVNEAVPQFYSTKNGLPANGVRSIAENEDGKIIVGTRYGGLAVFSPSNLRRESNSIQTILHSNGGLISDGIWSIQSLPENRIWLCTQAGVQEMIFGTQIHFMNLGRVPKVPFYSSALSNNGNLCFASGNLVYVYTIKDEAKAKFPMPVYFTRVLVNGQKINLKKIKSLPSNTYSITFEFVGVTNNLSDKSYHYRLRDVEKQFRTLYNENSVTYAGLGYGKYTFEVYGTNGDIRGETPASISFVIETPFYAQWYFILLSILVVILSVAFLIRQRMRRLNEVRNVRQRIAMDLHDEIGSGLTKISMLSEYALQDGPAESSDQSVIELPTDRIGKIARSLIDSMADVVWSIDPKYDTLADFVFNFRSYANELTEAKGIQLEIRNGSLEKVKIGPQMKRALQLVSKEALNNAVKYSGCRKIIYSLYVHNGRVFLSFEDDGCSFDRNNVELGNGINNMEKNARELNGKVTIVSAPDHGTKIQFQFPLKI